MKLPESKIKSTRINPKTIVIFSQPKMGKTTVVAELDNCLILDLENGSEFVDALKIDVIEESKNTGKLPIVVLKTIMNQIAEKNKEINGYVYKFIAIDTVSALEDIVLPLAAKMYRETPKQMGFI